MRAMAAAERPAPTVPRGRHAPPLEVRLSVQRRRLFEAAADVFARVGYAEASAEAISREAGMSKATFYEHFANKEECILALFDEAATEVMRAMAAASRRRGPRLLRGARGRRGARLPGDARLLSDVGADAARADHRRRAARRRAPRRDPRGLRRLALPRQPARRAPVRRAHLRVARRRLRGHRRARSSSSRAACAPAARRTCSRSSRSSPG